MSERKPIIIAGAAAAAVVVLFTLLVVRPKLAQIAETKERLTAAQEQEQTLRREISRLEAIRRDAPATIARLSRISRYLPSRPELPAFIRATQAAANQAGADLRSIAPSQPGLLTGATGIETIGVGLIVDGSYVRIQDFLARLEALERIVEVTSLSLSPQLDELSGRTLLSATINLTMYVVQPNASLRGAGGTTPTTPAPGAPS